MDVVFYDEDDSAPIRPPKAVKQSLFSRLIISSGLAKNVAQAEQVLLVCAILMLVIAVGIIVIGNLPSTDASQATVDAATARLKVEQLQAIEQAQAAEQPH